MPVHIVPSGASEDDTSVLQQAVKEIEAKGEQIVQVDNQTGFPNGRWIIYTTKGARRGGVEQR